MKSFISLVKMLFHSRRLLNYAIMAVIVISQSSCFRQFYQTNTTHKVDSAILLHQANLNKLFIVHTPTGPFSLKNAKVNSESLSGEKDSLDSKYEDYLNPMAETGNEFPGKQMMICFSQVHVYTDSSFEEIIPINLKISSINRMDIYGLDKTATHKDKVISIVGICVLGTAAIIGINAIWISEWNSVINGLPH